MLEYAQINRQENVVVRTRWLPRLNRDDGSNLIWVPLIREVPPPFDPAAQFIEQVVAITSSSVSYGWRVVVLAATVKTTDQVKDEFSKAIQVRLDAFASERLYDGILSACTYSASTDPIFAAEGRRCVALRDATWREGYKIMAEVAQGGPVPTWAEVEARLPALTWEVPDA